MTKHPRPLKLRDGSTHFVMLEVCQCGHEARGPMHGVCGNCGGAIEREDAQRDARWNALQTRLRGVSA